QLMAWSGALLKLFDVGAKWAAIAVLLNVFTGTSLLVGILLAGGISLIYITVGGLWADVWTDFAQ
ncbi:MAG: Na+:solute symporter, partial [Gammaproteobacteria bacterium]|nr:Na+:solute symporter [candidate division Zixibacteria bacterium]NIR95500.1 Na+:solute symporter [Gammaproteobacteria bacterium]NIT55556.1 Na+:solute symporter [Fodinibius sp.]NIS47114.1 Na+:solute symporter [candidate division Zixibacteria bacterium]NIU15253.1 Na+:solute symporter [candidate division Zixibacteria bacterium]